MLTFARAIVVDRGQEPKPPRELLDLSPPPVPPAADGGAEETAEDETAEGTP
jgi:hypothetical protein